MSNISDVIKTTLDKTNADRLLWSRVDGRQPGLRGALPEGRKAVYRAATGELSLELRVTEPPFTAFGLWRPQIEFSVRNVVKGEDEISIPLPHDAASAEALRPLLKALHEAITRNIGRQSEEMSGKADDVVEALRKA